MQFHRIQNAIELFGPTGTPKESQAKAPEDLVREIKEEQGTRGTAAQQPGHNGLGIEGGKDSAPIEDRLVQETASEEVKRERGAHGDLRPEGWVEPPPAPESAEVKAKTAIT